LLPAYRERLALHVISVIVWMTSVIMLPAIYARHVTTTPEVVRDAGLVELERGIIKRFVNPAMYAAPGVGILLIATPGTISWSAGWWWTKFIAMPALSGYYGALSA
jgi:putative membrane protein